MSRNAVRPIVLAAIAAGPILTCAYAGVLQQTGTPAPISPLGTYGMHVKASAVLSSLLPKGWHVERAPTVTLSEALSWQPKDTWVSVLSVLASHSNARFELNWNTHTLLIQPAQAPHPKPILRPVEKKPTKLKKTHLLKAHPWAPKRLKAVKKEPVRHETALAQVTPVAPGIALPAAAQASVQYHITLPPQPSAGPAQSFYAQSAKSILATLAKHYHLRLEWHGGNFRLPGPVTLLLDSHLHQDISLLQAALGPYAPLKVVYYAKSKELVVRHALSPQYLAFAQRPVAPPPPESGWDKFLSFFGASPSRARTERAVASPVAPVSVRTVPAKAHPSLLADAAVAQQQGVSSPMARKAAAAPGGVQTSAVSAPVLMKSAAALAPVQHCLFSLPIKQGERLSVSLQAFLLAQHLTLKWAVPYDLRSQANGSVKGDSVAAVLRQVLSAVGLSFTIHKTTQTVVVVPAASAAVATHVD